MNAFGNLLSSVSDIFEFNQATLSGCVDVIAVRQPDGSLKSTPFHVRFGKLKVLKSKDQQVKIDINGLPTDLTMTLGEAGEAFFQQETYKSAKSPDSSPKIRYCPVQNQSNLIIPVEVESNTAEAPESAKKAETPNEKLVSSLRMKYSASDDRTRAESKVSDDPNYDIYGQFVDLQGLQNNLQADQKSQSLSASPNKDGKKIKIKTLRPTSEQLSSLNLRPGANTITYKVRTTLQGTQTLTAHIYLWSSDANIIISDVDGTITKTDILGHVLPLLGKDWSQPGIAPLYSNLRRNGYHILYLTSRPIGQAKQTKDFLHSVYQDGKMLPHGPLVMSPDRMLPSVKREVLFRRPELFKMAVLKDIRSLFPADHNPFHAGFGNRETDAIAYKSVGIPLQKVFIVNPKGDIHHHHEGEAKSYALINTMIKEMFPGVLRDEKARLAEKLDESNQLQIDVNDPTLMQANVAKVIS